jgi:2-dehydro-3-deoxygluconokinase
MGGEPKMSDQKPNVVAIGEVMVELARGHDGRFGMSCGGDTFNTAVYLARAGIDAAYATALGDDCYSDSIVSMAAAEGVNTDLMLRVPGSPGSE